MPQDYLPDLVRRMQDSYEEQPHLRTQHVGFLPDTANILRLMQEMRSLLFPGFFDRNDHSNGTAAYQIADRLTSIRNQLTREISLAVCFRRRQAGRVSLDQCPLCIGEQEEAAGLADRFMQKLPAVRAMLADDVEAAFDGDPAAKSYSEVVLAYPGIYALTIHRLAHELYLLDIPLLPRIMSEHAHQSTGIDIHPGAKIGRFFFIDHGTGVVIGETTEIGDRVKLYQGVTLGALSTRGGQQLAGKKRHPTLKDRVTVYGGATILGGETVIGEGVTIGGNVFLTHSVEPDTSVSIGQPELKFTNRSKARYSIRGKRKQD